MKKSDMTFSPYQLELLGDFYRSNFSVSRFAQEKGIARITFWRWVRIFEDSNPEISAYMKKNKTFTGRTIRTMVNILIKGLLCYTKQFAKRDHRIGMPPFTKPFYCLVPAFFRIGRLNISSATSIIVSKACARILASLSSARKRSFSRRKAVIEEDSSEDLGDLFFFI